MAKLLVYTNEKLESVTFEQVDSGVRITMDDWNHTVNVSVKINRDDLKDLITELKRILNNLPING